MSAILVRGIFFKKCTSRASLPLEYVTSICLACKMEHTDVFENQTQKYRDVGII